MKIHNLIKAIGVSVLVFCFTMGICLIGQEVRKPKSMMVLDWNKILTHFMAYADNPNEENALRLLHSLPQDRPTEMFGDARAATRHIFGENYVILYEEAAAGDRIAIEILFRLLNISDGGSQEMILSDLGLIVRLYPKLFLEILSKYQETKHVKNFGYPVAFVGTGHNMHPRAEKHVLKKRLEAVSSVDDSEYKELRDACIKIIEEMIKKIDDDITRKEGQEEGNAVENSMSGLMN